MAVNCPSLFHLYSWNSSFGIKERLLAACERYLGLLGAERENYLSLNVPSFLFVDLVWSDVIVEFFYLCLPLYTHRGV